MSLLLDDIQLTAPAPNPVKGGQAQATGRTGIHRYSYWVVAHFPIGVSVSGPFTVTNAPDTLTAVDSIFIVWDRAIGATSYDVLRTDTPSFPQAAGNYALITGTTTITATDQGQSLTSYNPAGLPWGAPVTRQIRLNNRDYAQPTIELDALRVAQITFADGSTQTTAGGGASQTPWLSDIDGANFKLGNVSTIGVGIAANANNSLYINDTTGNANNRIQIQVLNQIGSAGIQFVNEQWDGGSIWMAGANVNEQFQNTFRMNCSRPVVIDSSQQVILQPPIGNPRFVGINTLNPAYQLDVDGDINSSVPPYSLTLNGNQILWRNNGLLRWNEQTLTPESGSNSGSDFYLTSYDDTGATLRTPIIIKRGTGNMYLLPNGGFLGVATTTPAHLLELGTDDAAKPGTNTWTVTSDLRTKRKVRRFEGDLEVIRKLDPIVAEYNGLGDTPAGARVVSFDPVALREILPYAVSSVRKKLCINDSCETDLLGINTHEIFFHLLRAVQQLDKQIHPIGSTLEQLNQKTQQLDRQMQPLEPALERLDQKIRKLESRKPEFRTIEPEPERLEKPKNRFLEFLKRLLRLNR